MKLNNRRDAFLFLAPTLLTYSLFLYLPIGACFLIAFSEYDILSPMKFVGLANFKWLFSYSRTLQIYLNTFKLMAIIVTLHTVVGLSLALLVKSLSPRWIALMRIIYYFPCILTTAAVAIAWWYMFHFDFGVLNYFLSLIGIKPIKWLTDTQWVYGSIALFSLWKFVGYSFVYFYIGLENIPRELYEAAQIDGAGSFRQFRDITLPTLSPTMFFVILNLCIGASQIFDEPYFLTRGGPGDATRTINLFIYETAYREFNFGHSSAIAITLFVLLVIFTLFQIRLSKKWVYYER